MRIVVNDIAASSGGALTVLRQFYDYIRANDPVNEWIFLLGGNFLEETENIKVIVREDIKKSHFRKLFFDFFTGRRFINLLCADVVFSLQNIITFGVKKPQIVYVHQSIPFQNKKKFSFFRANERALAIIQYMIGFIIRLSCRYADGVVVQTHWMKQAVAEQCHLKNSKIVEALPYWRHQESLHECSFNKKLFFYPTSDAVYKNNELLLKACDDLNNLGITDFKIILTLPPGRYSHPNISCVGHLESEEVRRYYNTCTLLFPSYIETVGLPLLEASAVGTLILAADTLFAHECLDGYSNSLFFDFGSHTECAELMKKIIAGEVVPSAECSLPENTNAWEVVHDFIISSAMQR